MMEVAMRQSLLLSQGSFMVFFTRPIAVTCLAIAALLLVLNLLPVIRQRRDRLAAVEVK
jgi:TctA family transporter